MRRLARKGELPGFKVGQDWRFRREALEQWMDRPYERPRKQRVLIVDDEPAIRDSLGELLRKSGYEATSAADGESALEQMQASVPDVILLDLHMPGMNGPQTLAEIRRQHGNIPVIIITGFPDGKLMNDALKHGPLHVLAKPTTKEHLLDALETAVARNRK